MAAGGGAYFAAVDGSRKRPVVAELLRDAMHATSACTTIMTQSTFSLSPEIGLVKEEILMALVAHADVGHLPQVVDLGWP